MHTVLLTLVALGIGPGDVAPETEHKLGPVPHEAHAAHVGCEHCAAGHGHAQASHRDIHKALKAQRNMMPQSCYDPTYGCYRGSRFMNRYPAFHGTYYRRPYNYRNYFDYPWHAELHEPTSLFSYNVSEQTDEAEPPSPRGFIPQPRSVVQPTPSVRPANHDSAETSEEPAIGTGVRAKPTSQSARRIRAVSLPRFRR